MAPRLTAASNQLCAGLDIWIPCSSICILRERVRRPDPAACSHTCCGFAGGQSIGRLSGKPHYLCLPRAWRHFGEEGFGILFIQNVKKCRAFILDLCVHICNLVLWDTSSWFGSGKLDSCSSEPSAIHPEASTSGKSAPVGTGERLGDTASYH